MWWPFKKNKFDKITRTDVVDNIINLEKQQQSEIDSVTEREQEIDKLMEQGRKTRSRDMQLALAKKINYLKSENSRTAQRIQYLNSNIQVLNQLKIAIDDKQFLNNNTNLSLNQLLTNTAELKKFLASVNTKKMTNEDNIVSALDTFEEVESSYEGNEKIYGKNEQDDQLLSMFEEQNAQEDDMIFGSEQEEEIVKHKNKDSI